MRQVVVSSFYMVYIHIFVPNNHGIFDYQCLAMIITEMFKKSLRASVEGQEFIMHNMCGYKHYFLTVIIKPCCLGGYLKLFCDHFAIILVKINYL